MLTSQCRRCKEVKLIEEFKTQDKYLCKVCHRKSVAEWKKKNPNKKAAQKKRSYDRKVAPKRELRNIQRQRKLLIRCLKKMKKIKIRTDPNKYIYILIDGKPYPEHRYIMEQHLGRKLKWGEEVHHINLQRNDNRIENLVVMPREEHRALHKRLRSEQMF